MSRAAACSARRSRARAIALAVLAIGLSLAPAAARVRVDSEVRALWVVRTSLASPASIATMVDAARASGFNTLLVQIRGRGDAYYAGGLEPRAATLAGQPDFDPLAETLARAHAAGLQVHAWINVNLVAGADLPSAREHVVYRHPEWLMVPRALAGDLAGLPVRGPEYLGRLTRYVRSQPAEIEGLYLSPIAEAAADYTVAVVRDIASRYAVDGVHFDYARYPNDDFDYSREALAAFRLDVAPTLASADAQRADGRLASDPLVYTQQFPDRWRVFRAARLTALMARLRDAVKASRPSATVSAAVRPDPAEASARRLQDWRLWLDRGLIDVVCPMAYTTDGDVFAAQIAAAREVAGRRPLWAGIGAYRLSADQVLEHVQAARRLGAGGIVFFSYDSLTPPSHGAGYLSQIGRAAFVQ
jgi:uncharacterized lipoprotein YddW (UPF0748 family)